MFNVLGRIFRRPAATDHWVALDGTARLDDPAALGLGIVVAGSRREAMRKARAAWPAADVAGVSRIREAEMEEALGERWREAVSEADARAGRA